MQLADQFRRASLLVAALLLSGCAAAPITRQFMAVGAVMDPELAPVRGCDALDGEWHNQGYRVDGRNLRPAVLTGAIDLAEAEPDAAFADRLRIERRSDGGLALIAMEDSTHLAVAIIGPGDINCSDSEASLRKPGAVRLSVDNRGALWVKASGALWQHSFVFQPANHNLQSCRVARNRSAAAPDGMAAVLVGAGDLQAQVLRADGIDTRSNQRQYEPRADVVFLLPGSHQFDIQVWTPGTFWTDRPQTTLLVSGQLEACRTYLPIGWHRSGEPSWAGLVELDPDFSVSCASTFSSINSTIRFSEDEARLLISQGCFPNEDWKTANAASPREVSLPPPLVSK